MIRAMLLLLASAAPAAANPPIVVWLDGVPVGTMAVFEYQISQGNLWIETHEGIFGCQQDRAFWDRFEER